MDDKEKTTSTDQTSDVIKAEAEEKDTTKTPSKEDAEPKKKDKRNKTKEKIDALEAEVKSLEEKFLRNAAELENFKKRMTQDRINDRKYASKMLIGELLDPLDQLDRIVSMKTDNDLLKNFLIGFKMINDKLYEVLKNDGLKEIDALGKPFDPKWHHAIETVNDQTKDNGINLDVVQKGYTYKDQLLRPVMVKVNEWSEDNGKEQ